MFTAKPGNAAVHRPFGCECWVKEYNPKSKVAAQGVECRLLGRDPNSPCYRMLEVGTKRIRRSPHVHFVPNCWSVRSVLTLK